jgi:hypothetical protein
MAYRMVRKAGLQKLYIVGTSLRPEKPGVNPCDSTMKEADCQKPWRSFHDKIARLWRAVLTKTQVEADARLWRAVLTKKRNV